MGFNFKQRIVDAWYKPYSWVLILIPLSWLFQMLRRLRRYYLESDQYHCPQPLIVVGNLAVGGSGKTPLVIHLTKLLMHQGFKVGIVSRGFGRVKTDQHFIIVTPFSDVNKVGDEPLMIAQRTNTHLIVCQDRALAVEKMLTHFPDTQIIISDDGLQHYKMARDVEIAVIQGFKRFGNGFCLPAGPLREPSSRLNRVDFIVASHEL